MEESESEQGVHALWRFRGNQAVRGDGCVVLSGEALQISEAQSKLESLTFWCFLEAIACLSQSGGLTLGSHIQQQLEVLYFWAMRP
tara:strand:+ start:329 stop:586 length:258 start_codon:yes stop_codon:yes gene_type:complete